METKKPYVDTYLIPGREVEGEWLPDWFVARYVDADGIWRCSHRHPNRDEAQACGASFGNEFAIRERIRQDLEAARIALRQYACHHSSCAECYKVWSNQKIKVLSVMSVRPHEQIDRPT